MNRNNILYKVYRLYVDGFRTMTLGREYSDHVFVDLSVQISWRVLSAGGLPKLGKPAYNTVFG